VLRAYPYENPMTGQSEWVVEDTVTARDVKTFGWPLARLRARRYVKTHEGAPAPTDAPSDA
jgi:hypothetical protein